MAHRVSLFLFDWPENWPNDELARISCSLDSRRDFRILTGCAPQMSHLPKRNRLDLQRLAEFVFAFQSFGVPGGICSKATR